MKNICSVLVSLRKQRLRNRALAAQGEKQHVRRQSLGYARPETLSSMFLGKNFTDTRKAIAGGLHASFLCAINRN